MSTTARAILTATLEAALNQPFRSLLTIDVLQDIAVRYGCHLFPEARDVEPTDFDY
jgi:hypothetical protein